jgi:hypothetical protein
MMNCEVKKYWKGSGCNLSESLFWNSSEWTKAKKWQKSVRITGDLSEVLVGFPNVNTTRRTFD